MIVLLGCVKTKGSERVAAADLYTSPLWHARRRYAEALGAAWYILSAKHGLVDPAEPLSPYELALGDRSAAERRAWGKQAVTDLAAQAGRLAGVTVEVHAGASYRDAVRGPLEERGAVLVNPLEGLGIGGQLAWYRAKGAGQG